MSVQDFPTLPPLKDPETPPSYTGSPFKDLLFLMLLTVLIGVAIYSLGNLILNYYYGKAAAEKGILYLLEHHKDNLNELRIFQLLNTVGVFLLPPIIFVLFCRDRPIRFFLLNKRPPFRDAWMIPGIVLGFFPMLAVMYFFNQQLVLPNIFSGLEQSIKEMEEQSNQFIMAMLQTKETPMLLVNMLLIAILPAICEEVFFRGTIQRILFGKTKDAHVAIILSAFLFSFFHFQFYGFMPRMALGMLFGYLFWWSGSLWTPILAHMINNAWQVYAAYLYFNGATDINIDEVNMLPLTTTLMSTGIFFLLCYLYYNASRLQQIPINKDERLGDDQNGE